MGNYGNTSVFKPDYRMFESPEAHLTYRSALASSKEFLVNKEELGHELQKGECDYDVLPSAGAYDLVKPVFLFRDPVKTFDS